MTDTANIIEDTCQGQFLLSVPRRLYTDNVRIWARTIAIIGSQPVIVVRIGGQSGNIVAGHIAHVQILIAGYVTAK